MLRGIDLGGLGSRGSSLSVKLRGLGIKGMSYRLNS